MKIFDFNKIKEKLFRTDKTDEIMNQKHFSELIKSFLYEKFPEFTTTLKYNTDDSFDCDLRSPSDEFSIWIATYNSEITIGLEDPSGKTDIHTHITCYEEEDIEDALIDLSNTINEIREGKTILYHSDQNGYQWANTLYLERKKINGNLRVYSWKKNE